MRKMLWLSLLTSLALRISTAQDSHIPFAITISAASNVFKTGSEIQIKLVLTNTSNDEVPYVRGPGTGVEPRGELFTSVDVRDAKGERVPDTGYSRALRGKPETGAKGAGADKTRDVEISAGPPLPRMRFEGSFVGRLLKPGESREEDIVVSKLYDMKTPGRYSITASRRLFNVADHPYSKIEAKSNTIVVTVTN